MWTNFQKIATLLQKYSRIRHVWSEDYCTIVSTIALLNTELQAP